MLERLNQLETNVIELRKFEEKYTFEQIKNDIHLQWTLRYGIFESIQIVIDIACHLTSKYNLGNPRTYSECVEFLHNEDYLDKEITDRLLGMIGLRNILIHEYVEVDLKKLHSLLQYKDDFKIFASEVKDYV